eukprot:6202897-Pleurochrysis_carterae.AAC.1
MSCGTHGRRLYEVRDQETGTSGQGMTKRGLTENNAAGRWRERALTLFESQGCVQACIAGV